jgi:hypothetical protein
MQIEQVTNIKPPYRVIKEDDENLPLTTPDVIKQEPPKLEQPPLLASQVLVTTLPTIKKKYKRWLGYKIPLMLYMIAMTIGIYSVQPISIPFTYILLGIHSIMLFILIGLTIVAKTEVK